MRPATQFQGLGGGERATELDLRADPHSDLKAGGWKVTSIERKSLDSPDQTAEPFEKGKIETVTVVGIALQRETLQAGWRWSEHVKPHVGGASCQKRHLKYMIAGRQHVVMDDGTEMELVPGDFAVIEPGHDAWVVGGEPNVLLEMIAIERPAG